MWGRPWYGKYVVDEVLVAETKSCGKPNSMHKEQRTVEIHKNKTVCCYQLQENS